VNQALQPDIERFKTRSRVGLYYRDEWWRRRRRGRSGFLLLPLLFSRFSARFHGVLNVW